MANPETVTSEASRGRSSATGYDPFALEPREQSAGASGSLRSNSQSFFWKGRMLVWFSCGAASAVTAKLVVDKYRRTENIEVLYCDTLKYEHPDNPRFLRDVEQWIGCKIKLLRSAEYSDIFDVFDRVKYMVGIHGATCTARLKRDVRKAYQWAEDTHFFGYTADERERILRFEEENPSLRVKWILADAGITKRDCYGLIQAAKIELPMMYKLGYRNNNCIGCVKGQAGYWNKIRRDFPEAFERMAAQERKMNVAICKTYKGGTRTRVFLDELPPTMGRYDEEPDFECGPQCVMPSDLATAFDGKLVETVADAGREVCGASVSGPSESQRRQDHNFADQRAAGGARE